MRLLKKKFSFAYLAVCLLCVIVSMLCSVSSASAEDAGKRILFLGNSYTGYNGGIDKHLKGLMPGTVAARITPGGVKLEGHWRNAGTLNIIRTGKWDFVVLQEQSQTPIFDSARFSEYAGKLDAEIRQADAQTVLFMTWERPDSVRYGVTTANLSETFTRVGWQHGVKVAPVGLAFAGALKEHPGLALYSPDGHPTLQGTYLAACVFYGMIFWRTPVGNPYSAGLSSTEKNFLQQTAAKTLGY